LQRKWWQGTAVPPAKHLPTPFEQQRYTLDLTENWAYKRDDKLTDEQAAALSLPSVDDHSWDRVAPEIWLTPNDHTRKRIILRRTFTVPKQWTDGPVFLSTSGAVDGARTFFDGKPLFGGSGLWDGASLDDLGGGLKPGTSHVLTLDVYGGNPLIGAKGPAWLTYLPDARQRQDLSGPWSSYSTELHAAGPVMLPGVVSKVAFLSRSVVIDRAREGSNVVIYGKPEGGGIGGVLTNGKRLDSGGPYLCLNITPFINFGEENTIELALSPNDQHVSISQIEIRYYDKGVYP
jgi:hypothetical protein